MSNFSDIYELYLRGYCGFETGVQTGTGYPTTERLCQALALGVYHRITQKPPFMQSGDVVAELKKMRTPVKQPQTHFDVIITKVGETSSSRIAVIKAVRGLTNLGLREAKNLVDEVAAFNQQAVLSKLERRSLAESAAKVLIEAGATVEIR